MMMLGELSIVLVSAHVRQETSSYNMWLAQPPGCQQITIALNNVVTTHDTIYIKSLGTFWNMMIE